MSKQELKNKPLVEAIFELRWKLQELSPGTKLDPHYKILLGRIYDRVGDKYPYHEQLPTSTMPDEIAAHIVQHRFRKGEGEWPLVQMGPGIITLNDTDGYVWEDFEIRISGILKTLFESYPDADTNLSVNQLLLRYIDAIDFDFEKEDIFLFLREKLKTNFEIYEKLFEDTGVMRLPLTFDSKFSFPSTKPVGAVDLRFSSGKKKGKPALMWQTMVSSKEEDVPKSTTEIAKWVRNAHELTDDWFFKMIEGELLRRFE